MIIPTSSLQQIEQILLSGQSAFVPTESVYEEVQLLRGENWPVVDHPQLGEISICLVAEGEQIQRLVAGNNRKLKQLLDSLTPGPVAFLVQAKSGSQVRKLLVQVPANPLTKQLLAQLGQPLWATRASRLPLTNLEMLQLLPDEQDVYALEDGKTSGVEPVILDVRRIHRGRVDVLRPGMWDWRELLSLDTDLQIREKFKTAGPLASRFKLVQSINQIPETGLKLLLGTKEELIREFGWSVAQYFRIREHEDFLLLNLGSLANPESILKNLYRNLNLAGLLGFQDIFVLAPTLHRPYHLRRTLDYILDQNTVKAEERASETLEKAIFHVLPDWPADSAAVLAA